MGEVTDRYSIDPLNGPAALAEKLAALERRVSGLEGATLYGITFVALDDSGDEVVVGGTLSDGSRGFQIISAANGWDLLKATDAGWIKPHLMGSAWSTTSNVPVTSATFVDTFAVTFGEALGPGVEIGVPWATAAGTTGELQVSSNLPGTSASIALAANSSGYLFLRWLHGMTVGAGPLEFRLEARRTAGAGNVTIFPVQGWVQDPALCSTGGTWV